MTNSSPPPPGSELMKRVAATANRLRLVQMDFADDGAESRQEQLAEEIERALAGIIPEERGPFLEALRDLFPSWDANVELRDGAPAGAAEGKGAAAASAMDQKELKDASFLVTRLIAVCKDLPESERAGVVAALSRAGLAPPAAAGGISETVMDDLRVRLQVSGQQTLSPDRAVELAAQMGEVLASLDQVVWNTWRMLSPKATIRRPAPLARTMGRYAAGDPEIGKQQVKQEVELLRKLTAALISSVSQAGRVYAQRHSDKFSPAAIEALAKMSPGKFMESQETKCWKKYVELAGPMDAASIEAEFMQAIAGFAESLMKGIGR